MNGFTIYKEYYELITLLDEKEQQEILLAITKYMFENVEPILNDRQQKVFNNLRRPLDKSRKNSKRATRTEPNENQTVNQTGNQIENQTGNQMVYQKKTHQDVNVNVNVNDNVNNIFNNLVKDIINYLNKKTNSNFKYTTKSTQTKIKTRLNEGYTLDDFIVVIDKKTDEWLEDSEFSKYLCPETLFGTKFEKYLNQKSSKKDLPDWFDKKIDKGKLDKQEEEKMKELLGS